MKAKNEKIERNLSFFFAFLFLFHFIKYISQASVFAVPKLFTFKKLKKTNIDNLFVNVDILASFLLSTLYS